jgi:hypothetical protein
MGERAQVVESAAALEVGEHPGPALDDRAVAMLPNREDECIAIAEVVRHSRVVAMPRRGSTKCPNRQIRPPDR